MGYFGAAAMCGIAADGDDARGTEMRRHARDVWNRIIVPGYRARLEGGDYPEGWQYARLVGAVLGMYVDAEGRTIPGAVTAISPEVRQNQVIGRVKFRGQQPPGLRQNERAAVRIVLDERDNVLKFERGSYLDATSRALHIAERIAGGEKIRD